MALPNKSQLNKPGEFNLAELSILSYIEENSLQKLDLRGMLYNFEISEDILNNNIAVLLLYMI